MPRSKFRAGANTREPTAVGPSSNLLVSLPMGDKAYPDGKPRPLGGDSSFRIGGHDLEPDVLALGIVVVVGAIGGWFVARALGF